MPSANINFPMISIYKKEKFICSAEVADSYWSRAMGLMFRKELSKDKGLLIRFSPTLKSKTIHSFFMRFPLDLIFINEEKKIVEITSLKPWKIYNPKQPCVMVLEVKAGTIDEKEIKSGDVLEWQS